MLHPALAMKKAFLTAMIAAILLCQAAAEGLQLEDFPAYQTALDQNGNPRSLCDLEIARSAAHDLGEKSVAERDVKLIAFCTLLNKCRARFDLDYNKPHKQGYMHAPSPPGFERIYSEGVASWTDDPVFRRRFEEASEENGRKLQAFHEQQSLRTFSLMVTDDVLSYYRRIYISKKAREKAHEIIKEGLLEIDLRADVLSRLK